MSDLANRLMTDAVEIQRDFNAGRLRGHEKEAMIRIDERIKYLAIATGRDYNSLSREISRRAEEETHG